MEKPLSIIVLILFCSAVGFGIWRSAPHPIGNAVVASSVKTGFSLGEHSINSSLFLSIQACEIVENAESVQGDFYPYGYIEIYDTRDKAVEESKKCLQNFVKNEHLTWCRTHAKVTYFDEKMCESSEEDATSAKAMLKKL